MLDHIKAKVLFLNVSKGTFVDDRDRQVGYCKTTIAIQGNQTEEYVGYDIRSITGAIEDFDLIKNYIGRQEEVVLEMRPSSKDTYKMKFVQIADVEL